MDTKFTPGPWYESAADDGAFTISNSKEFVPVIASRNEWNNRAAESMANARLIAAAPDMYEALKEVAAHFDGTDAPLGIKARAALAKVQP